MTKHVLSFSILLLSAPTAWADGPHIAFHATSGSITVTLFSAPDPLVAGPADLALLVQRTSDNAAIPHASAQGTLRLSGHAPIAFTLAPGGGGQLPEVTVPLPAAGDYALTLAVQAGGSAARFSGDLPVDRNNGRRNTVLWTVSVPPILTLLFLVNQYAKQRIRRYPNRPM